MDYLLAAFDIVSYTMRTVVFVIFFTSISNFIYYFTYLICLNSSGF